jgi:hypothetical protein
LIPPTGIALDREFGQSTKCDRDRLIVATAFCGSALQTEQLGLA